MSLKIHHEVNRALFFSIPHQLNSLLLHQSKAIFSGTYFPPSSRINYNLSTFGDNKINSLFDFGSINGKK